MIRRALKHYRRLRTAALLPAISPGGMIPRILHQIYFNHSGHVLPAEIQANIAKLRRLNPGWSYRLYDLAAMQQFVLDNYGARVLEYLLRIDPAYGAARADLFRYLLLYRVGGVYMDIKSSMSRPLDEVLRGDDQYLLSHWPRGPGQRFENWGIHAELAASRLGEFQQWHIVAAAGHPFLRAVLEDVLTNIGSYNHVLDGTGWAGVLRTTGPIAYSLAILPRQHLHAHRVVDALADLGFQYSIYAHHNEHHDLFGHYTQRTDPIVRPTLVDKALSGIVLGLKATRGLLAQA